MKSQEKDRKGGRGSGAGRNLGERTPLPIGGGDSEPGSAVPILRGISKNKRLGSQKGDDCVANMQKAISVAGPPNLRGLGKNSSVAMSSAERSSRVGMHKRNSASGTQKASEVPILRGLGKNMTRREPYASATRNANTHSLLSSVRGLAKNGPQRRHSSSRVVGPTQSNVESDNYRAGQLRGLGKNATRGQSRDQNNRHRSSGPSLRGLELRQALNAPDSVQ